MYTSFEYIFDIEAFSGTISYIFEGHLDFYLWGYLKSLLHTAAVEKEKYVSKITLRLVKDSY